MSSMMPAQLMACRLDGMHRSWMSMHGWHWLLAP